jgi:hypothetical protein
MNLGANSPLDAVTGTEAMAALYTQFFRWFVMRKRQELVSPHFLPISEISLPRMSLFHYFPQNVMEIGPSRSEAFISNFEGDVFLDFVSRYEPVLGSGRNLPLEIRKAIQGYRATHYNYNWTKDIKTVYNKERNLIVKSYGLLDKMFAQRASIFVNFEKYYNHFNALVAGINEEAHRVGTSPRQQFMRVDLPINFPGFNELLIDYDHYIDKFNHETGKPIPSNQTVRLTKAEGSYWLIDFMAWVFGDYEYSLFNKLTPEALNALHIIFVFDSRCLIIHMATIKEWLDNENDKKYLEKLAAEAAKGKAPAKTSHRTGHSKRLNAAKRFYLALMNLSRGGISEQEKDDPNGEASGTALVEGADRTEEEQGREGPHDRQEKARQEDGPVVSASTGDSLLDVLQDNRASVAPSVDVEGSTGDGNPVQDDQEWNSAVDDKLLEQEVATAEVSVKKDPFATPEAGVALALEERARNGSLSVAEQQFFMRKGTQYKHIEMPNGQTLEEFMKVSQEDLKSLKSDAKIEANFTTILDESMLVSKANILKQGYVDKFLHKDIVSMFVGIQNAGIALNNFKHDVVTSVEGEYDVFSIQLHPVDGEQSTHVIRVPRVQKDSTFTVDGVKTHMQLQRRELPIRKIDRAKVALSSYYPNRLMVTRSKKVAQDLGVWMSKQIMAQGDAGNLTFNRGNKFDQSLPSPRVYSALATRFQWIKAGEYTFDFRVHNLLAEYPDFKKYLKKDNFLIGVKDGKPLTTDSYGNIYIDGVELGTLEGLMGISLAKAPIEFASINIGGFLFPIGVVLCYYFGIDTLLAVTKATTRSVPNGTRPKLSEDEYAIAFNDEYLIFNRREKFAAMIFGGLVGLGNISNFSKSDLNNNGVWGPLMADPKVKTRHFREMKNLFDLFIDPITKEQLQKLGYADSFHYLLLDAVQLLETDQTRHEVELEEQRIVGYERFAGHIYSEMCEANRRYHNKGKDRKHKFEINPDAVTMRILTDTSVNLVEEVNPVHQTKDQEELTFGGTGGRSEITVVQRAREQLPTYRGRISEANKDSGKVGFVTYTTSDPLIDDYRGNMDLKGKPSFTSLMSVTGNLSVSVTKDDAKRQVFISTQWSQAVSAKNYTWGITRTGYDSVMAHRTSELYSKVAKEEGKVTAVEDDQLVVTYKDGSVDRYPLGLVIGEASGEYHRHTRVTDLKVGDKFRKGDVIGWDNEWFARDPFNPGQAVLKTGRMVRIAMVEDQDTFEDSIAVSRDIVEESVTPFLNPVRFTMLATQAIGMRAKVGDEIDYDAILCEIEDGDVLSDGPDSADFSNEINRLGIRQIRSRNHGKIIHIDVKYNSPQEEMSETVKKLVKENDKKRKRFMETEGKEPVTGAVNTNLNVAKPVIPPGLVLITIYVETLDVSTMADKYVLGNQMKCTTGYVMPKPIYTLDGKRVDVKTSFKGMLNRMVNSLRDEAASNEVVSEFSKLAVKVYRGIK